MMRMGSLGKPTKGDTHDQAVAGMGSGSGRFGRKLDRASSSGHSFISRLTSMGSLRSRRTKSGSHALAAPSTTPRSTGVALHDINVDPELAELEVAFKVFDANGDGQICIEELGAVLRSLGGEVSQEELQMIMDDADTNHDGFICLEEFKAVNRSGGALGADLHRSVGDSRSPREDPIREAFATFDKDGNNLISADELRAVLQSLGDTGHSLDDCRRMISRVDQNGDGFVDYKEFESLLSARS